MLGSASMRYGDMPGDLEQKVRTVCALFERAVQKDVEARKVIPAFFPALFPCNIFTVIDSQNLHVVFSHINAGGMPVQTWLDQRTQGPFPAPEIIKAAVEQQGLVNPTHFVVLSAVLDWPEPQQVSDHDPTRFAVRRKDHQSGNSPTGDPRIRRIAVVS